MQRRDFSARRNAGLLAADSDRALIIRAPPDGSFDHDGTSPQRTIRSVRSTCSGSGVPSSSRGCRSTTATTCLVGATLKSATFAPSVASTARNSSARSLGAFVEE